MTVCSRSTMEKWLPEKSVKTCSYWGSKLSLGLFLWYILKRTGKTAGKINDCFGFLWGSELSLWLLTWYILKEIGECWKNLEKQVHWDDQSQLHHLLTSVFVGRRPVKVLPPPVLNYCTDMQGLMLDCLSAKKVLVSLRYRVWHTHTHTLAAKTAETFYSPNSHSWYRF